MLAGEAAEGTCEGEDNEVPPEEVGR